MIDVEHIQEALSTAGTDWVVAVHGQRKDEVVVQSSVSGYTLHIIAKTNDEFVTTVIKECNEFDINTYADELCCENGKSIDMDICLEIAEDIHWELMNLRYVAFMLQGEK